MTTVGYGDIYPVTWPGRVIGALCAVFGVLLIGLPVNIIGNSFADFYQKEKMEKRKKRFRKKCSKSKSNVNKAFVHSISSPF